ncbi:n-acetyltransferase 9 [Pyrenophora seminiperda CCB06]|uniref:N-acetyltransferase 9 n=1 Tax=Pyrenophora seminiperda CCB06 TaxID=1302712 RepID=A0A3M7MHA0_9PLEO|nr:n-acetyltransferase 9 [Pyrenophora seminiperda CCB06]
MIGDVNLFLYRADDDESDEDVVGELEIMIARTEARGRGLAKEAVQAFMWYVVDSLPAVLDEYARGCAGGNTTTNNNSSKKPPSRLSYFRVKIDKDNVRSLGLFENTGFRRVSEPNFFGEVELRADVGGEAAQSGKRDCIIAQTLSYGQV